MLLKIDENQCQLTGFLVLFIGASDVIECVIPFPSIRAIKFSFSYQQSNNANNIYIPITLPVMRAVAM